MKHFIYQLLLMMFNKIMVFLCIQYLGNHLINHMTIVLLLRCHNWNNTKFLLFYAIFLSICFDKKASTTARWVSKKKTFWKIYFSNIIIYYRYSIQFQEKILGTYPVADYPVCVRAVPFLGQGGTLTWNRVLHIQK